MYEYEYEGTSVLVRSTRTSTVDEHLDSTTALYSYSTRSEGNPTIRTGYSTVLVYSYFVRAYTSMCVEEMRGRRTRGRAALKLQNYRIMLVHQDRPESERQREDPLISSTYSYVLSPRSLISFLLLSFLSGCWFLCGGIEEGTNTTTGTQVRVRR